MTIAYGYGAAKPYPPHMPEPTQTPPKVKVKRSELLAEIKRLREIVALVMDLDGAAAETPFPEVRVKVVALEEALAKYKAAGDQP